VRTILFSALRPSLLWPSTSALFRFALCFQISINLTKETISQNKEYVKRNISLDIDFQEAYKESMKLLTTPEVAERLGITLARVQQLIWKGRLPAQKIGRDYVINEDDLKLVAERKPGRPANTGKPESKRKAKDK
jgi:excisionase family DNA binding protein